MTAPSEPQPDRQGTEPTVPDNPGPETAPSEPQPSEPNRRG